MRCSYKETWGPWTIAIAAVAAVTLASSGAALAQEKTGASSAPSCMQVKGGGCVMTKAGTEIGAGAASKAAPKAEAKNEKTQKESSAK